MGKRIRLDDDDLAYEAMVAAEWTAAKEAARCPTGKKSFSTRSRAANIAKSMRHRNNDPFVNEYQCQQCGLWHTGHPKGTPQNRGDLKQFFGKR